MILAFLGLSACGDKLSALHSNGQDDTNSITNVEDNIVVTLPTDDLGKLTNSELEYFKEKFQLIDTAFSEVATYTYDILINPDDYDACHLEQETTGADNSFSTSVDISGNLCLVLYSSLDSSARSDNYSMTQNYSEYQIRIPEIIEESGLIKVSRNLNNRFKVVNGNFQADISNHEQIYELQDGSQIRFVQDGKHDLETLDDDRSIQSSDINLVIEMEGMVLHGKIERKITNDSSQLANAVYETKYFVNQDEVSAEKFSEFFGTGIGR